MLAEIISIGDELLIGQVVNTNASWMAEKLNEKGIRVKQITAISDEREHIFKALNEAAFRADIILLTGGLGPTKDDITKQTLAAYFNSKLIFNQETFDNIINIFGKYGRKISHLNRDQAMIPDSSIPIKNSLGTAPGMWFEQHGKIYVSMPGVPFEMKAMMVNYIIPELQKHCSTEAILHKTVLTSGIGESALAEIIEDWETGLPDNIKLAYLPKPGIVRLRLSAYGQDESLLRKTINLEIQKLELLIPELIFGYDDDSLEKIVGDLLRKTNKTLAVAESCTGGLIAHLITSVPGSSDYFMGGVVAYANEIKQSFLGVSGQNLLDFGAVSEQVAIQMARGIKEKMNADYAISTTGIAGPSGGTEEKPVGTVWIAVATPSKIIAKHYQMGDHRGRNIQRTAIAALNMLRKTLKSS